MSLIATFLVSVEHERQNSHIHIIHIYLHHTHIGTRGNVLGRIVLSLKNQKRFVEGSVLATTLNGSSQIR